MTQHVAVADGQALLVAQRNHLPISLVGFEHHLLFFGPESLLSHLFAVARDAVVSADFSAHIKRLRQQCGRRRHVSRVGSQSVNDVRSDAVHGASNLRQIVAALLDERCEVRKLLDDLSGYFAKLSRHRCSESRERLFLVFGEQRNLVARAYVASHDRHFRQIIGACRPAHVVGLLSLCLANRHRLVVGHRHSPAAVERERLPHARHCPGKSRCDDDER